MDLVSDLNSVITSNQKEVIINIRMVMKSIEESIDLCYAADDRDKILSIRGIEEHKVPLEIQIPALNHDHIEELEDIGNDLSNFFEDTPTSQELQMEPNEFGKLLKSLLKCHDCQFAIACLHNIYPVSYTHLTLPTIYSV